MATIELGNRIMDRDIISKDDRRCGKVDDLLLEWDESEPTAGPVVEAIITGPMALSRDWPAPIRSLICRVYELVGVKRPRPTEISWERVEEIGAVVRLDLNRDEARLSVVYDAIGRRFIDRLPGA